MTRVPVLCVDDEPRVIGALALQLRRGYEVTSAHSGGEGLEILRRKGPFAVVLSDMRMPGMDGASFLAHAREVAPDTVRMVLTGQSDLLSAIAAVNDGQIFRFLTKPCPPDQLRLAFDAAAEQYRLITTERVLLEQTLHGSIKTLVDVLSLTNPVSFGRAMRVKRHVSELADRLNLRERWQVEVAAMLSQLGTVTLPAGTAERVLRGERLSAEEEQMVGRVPAITEQLLANIPRLEIVRGILAQVTRRYKAVGVDVVSPEQALVNRGADMLRIVLDYDALEAQGHLPWVAAEKLAGHAAQYDADIFELFQSMHRRPEEPESICELPLTDVRPGMVFAEDVSLASGMLLARSGYEVTEGFIARVRNQPGERTETVRVHAAAVPR